MAKQRGVPGSYAGVEAMTNAAALLGSAAGVDQALLTSSFTHFTQTFSARL